MPHNDSLSINIIIITGMKQTYNTNSVLEHYTPTRTLRSSDTNLLRVPRVHTCFGSRGFSVAAPTIWNSLPLDIHYSCSIASFRRQLKTFLFFNLWPSLAPRLTPAPQIRRVSRRQYCALDKFIYLLTYGKLHTLPEWNYMH